ncbi:hypothetical protein ABZP36_012272 [Zizania latifolia]
MDELPRPRTTATIQKTGRIALVIVLTCARLHEVEAAEASVSARASAASLAAVTLISAATEPQAWEGNPSAIWGGEEGSSKGEEWGWKAAEKLVRQRGDELITRCKDKGESGLINRVIAFEGKDLLAQRTHPPIELALEKTYDAKAGIGMPD